MAKSIDEMARIECCNDIGAAYFKYGANYVLDELQKVITDNIHHHIAWDIKIADLIKKLKGL